MPCVHKLFSHGVETLLPPPPLYAIAALGCLSIFFLKISLLLFNNYTGEKYCTKASYNAHVNNNNKQH